MKNSNPSQCQRVIKHLSDGQWHSVMEFQAMNIPRYSARICELRKKGFNLEKRPIPGKNYEEWRNEDLAKLVS